jgi:hypothetical protein
MGLKSFAMIGIRGIADEMQRFIKSLEFLGVKLLQPRPILTWRHVIDTMAWLAVFVLLAIVTDNMMKRSLLRGMANFVLVVTEFSYDKTCTASNETHWIAPLKDRKEMKISNVLIADVQSWTDIRFEISQCEKVPFDQNW